MSILVMPEDSITKLVSRIIALDQIKSDTEYAREIREKAEDESAKCYEQLLALCGGDVAHVANLLGQKEWFDATRKRKLP